MTLARPDLDLWLPEPTLRVAHQRKSTAPPDRVWGAARSVQLRDAALLGRLVRWRIPGMPAEISFDEMFRRPPFIVLDSADHALVVGLVGRIWTLRRDYPRLANAEEFRNWSARGTAQVLFANWVSADGTLHSEARVRPIGRQGRIGVAAVRPLVAAFQQLIGSDGLAVAVRRAEKE